MRGGEYTVEESTSAGLDYVDLVLGRTDALVYTWGHPWDHAAGLLLLEEAGGTSHNVDGSPFSLTGGNALPLIATAGPGLANRLAAHLNDEG
jgi:fructose-1,6-bisphosphatase/inositol monophosphatase family enzyme